MYLSDNDRKDDNHDCEQAGVDLHPALGAFGWSASR